MLLIAGILIGLLYSCVSVVDKLPTPQPSTHVESDPVSAEAQARLRKCIELLQVKEEVLKEWATLPAGTSQRRTQLERKLVIISDGEKICRGE